jgi:hypothetical protein
MTQDTVLSGPRRVALALVILVALGVLAYFTHYLFREELRDWQVVEVLFDDVGGLRKDDDVLVGGARMGRVHEIVLFDDRQLVRLQVLPDVELHDDAEVKIVAANSLGYVDVEMTPGSPGRPPLAPGQKLRGKVAGGVGQGASVPGRRRLLTQSIRGVADATAEMQDPRSGRLGQLLFDPEGVQDLRLGLRQVDDLWKNIDAGLAQAQAGQSFGAGLDPATLDAVGNTVAAFKDTLGGAARGLREVGRGEGRFGRFAADPVHAGRWREYLIGWNDAWSDAAQGRGTFGRMTDPTSGFDVALERALGSAEQTTREAVAGEGILGALSSEAAGDATRSFLRSAPAALEELEHGPLIDDADARWRLSDTLGDVEDRLINLRRGAARIRMGLPSRT